MKQHQTPAIQPLCLPRPVAEILARLHAGGYTAEVVGGCVRSLLLGARVADWDICTSALPQEVAACFADSPVLETGLAHGTVTLVRGGAHYEITTYRTDGTYTDHRRPDAVRFTRALEDDLARRDFTVNAMAYSPARGLVDLFGGQKDLAARVLRCVGTPDARFAEDALRILRGLRFAATLDFIIEAGTAQAAVRQAQTLQKIAAERVFSELTKLLCGCAAGRVLAVHGAVLAAVLPWARAMQGFAQNNPHHNKDVWQHTAAAVQSAASSNTDTEPDIAVRWALLLHDAGKPQCYTETADGTGHFYGHARLSTAWAHETLCALRAPTALRENVCALVAHHDMPLEATRRCAVGRLHKLGAPVLMQLLEVKRCDALAHAPQTIAPRLAELDAFAACLGAVLEDEQAFSLRQLAINGADVLAQGVPHGPAVGEALRAALALVMDGVLPNDRAALLQWLSARKT